jgi:uncharacterized membrane protein YccC
MKTTLCILACIGLCIVFARLESRRSDKRIAEAFEGRESILEEQLSANMSRMQAQDDLTRELRFSCSWSMQKFLKIAKRMRSPSERIRRRRP